MAGSNVEEIIIRIRGDAKGGLDALEQIGDALGNLKKSWDQVTQPVKQVIQPVKDLGAAWKAASGAGGAGAMSASLTKLQSQSTALSNQIAIQKQRILEAANADKTKASSALTLAERLRQLEEKYRGNQAAIAATTERMSEMQRASAPLPTAINAIKSALGTLTDKARGAIGVLGELAGAFGRSVQALGKTVMAGIAAPIIAALGGIVAAAPGAVNAASDLNESMSKANVVFGGSITAVDDFASTSAKSFGIARQEAYESTATFGNLFVTMGLGQKTASGMSVDVVKLAADLASFNNLNSTEVLEKLRSGLIGEAEPLRSLGVMLTEDAVKAKAMQLGLVKANGELTEGAKVQARYALILEQTKTAQGDFARTSDQLANTQRKQAAQWKDLQAKIGTVFLPVVIEARNALGALADGVLPRLDDVLKVIGPTVTDVGNSIGIFVDTLMRTGNPIGALSAALVNFPDIKATFDNIVAGAQSFLASIQPTIDQVRTWLNQNVSLRDVLTALGIAVAAVVIPAIVSIVAAVAPVVAAFAGLVAIVALVRQVWDENLWGIRDTLTNAWSFLQPLFAQLWQWLQVNVPAAIQTLSNFWNTTLLPALRATWEFLDTYIVPLLASLANVYLALMSKAVEALAGLWQNVLKPALDAAMPVLIQLRDLVLPPLSSAFDAIGRAIQTVIGYLNGLAERIRNLTLPSWLTPGSPTPFELGLWGVADAAQQVGGMIDQTLNVVFAKLLEILGSIVNVIGGAAGLLSDWDDLKKRAASSWDSVGQPLSDTLFAIRNMAAEAGNAVGSIAGGLAETASFKDLVVNIKIITEHIDIYREEYPGGGGGGGGGGGHPQYQHGGWTREGLARLHNYEFVLSEAMRHGAQAIPAGVLSAKALARLVGGAMVASSNVASVIFNQQIEGGINFPNVRDGRDGLGVKRELARTALTARMAGRA